MDMGNERSLRRVAEQLHKSETIIGRWSGKHNWVERVAAWDAEQDRLIRIELTKDIGHMRKRHADLADKLLLKAASAMEQMKPEDIKPSDIPRMVEVASKLERISRGDVGEVVEERDGGPAIPAVQFYMPDNGRDKKEE